jgi:hypothetical protein
MPKNTPKKGIGSPVKNTTAKEDFKTGFHELAQADP